jgi:hypothetical protein
MSLPHPWEPEPKRLSPYLARSQQKSSFPGKAQMMNPEMIKLVNKIFHDVEALFYDMRHPEIFSYEK